jgi:predicted Zn-dependent peptidase
VQNRHGISVWYEQADITSEHTIDALNEIEKEINHLKVEPPTEDELNGIKKYEAGIFVLRNSSPAGIINQLSFVDQHGLDKSYLSNYVKNIYLVTPEKVTQVMKDHYDYSKMQLVMVGDKATIQQQITKQKENKKVF